MPNKSGKNKSAPAKDELSEAYVRVVSDVQQGDLISLGAVTLVGRGATQAWRETSEYEKIPTNPEAGSWSLTIDSEVDWYAIISQDCDIARTPDIEPALVVCPVNYISDAKWAALRAGGTSPREFPLPDGRKLPVKPGYKPIVNLRFVTSIDKTALTDGSVKFLRPLSAPQRARFSSWVGSRYSRAPHPDDLERDVLPRVATLLQKMATDLNPKSRSNPEYRLVDAAESWYIGGSTRRVVFVIFTSESSAKNSGLWDTASLNFDLATVSSATKRLASKMLASLKPGDGYTIEVQVKTLRGIYAADFLVLSEWVIEEPGDPLAAD